MNSKIYPYTVQNTLRILRHFIARNKITRLCISEHIVSAPF